MTISPRNLTAQLYHRAAGNPPSTLPDSAISNCFLGLEFDFRRPPRFGGRTAVQSQPRSRASRAAAVRLGAPSLRMASDR